MFIYALICFYPILWMIFYSFKDNEEIFVTNPFGPPIAIRWENYVRAVSEFNIAIYFKNSVIVSVISLCLGVFFSLIFTYAVARMPNRLSKTMRAIVVLGMFIPIQAIMTPLVVMVKNLRLTNTLWSLIVPYVAFSFPFAVMVLYGFYINLPMDLEESAYIEGAGFYRTYFQIIFPLMKAPISVLISYQFMGHWNEFSLALVLTTKNNLKTLPLGLSSFMGMLSTDWGPIGACLVIASLPVMLLYIFFSDKISDAMAYTGIKS